VRRDRALVRDLLVEAAQLHFEGEGLGTTRQVFITS
jgi:hypothetical protein